MSWATLCKYDPWPSHASFQSERFGVWGLVQWLQKALAVQLTQTLQKLSLRTVKH